MLVVDPVIQSANTIILLALRPFLCVSEIIPLKIANFRLWNWRDFRAAKLNFDFIYFQNGTLKISRCPKSKKFPPKPLSLTFFVFFCRKYFLPTRRSIRLRGIPRWIRPCLRRDECDDDGDEWSSSTTGTRTAATTTIGIDPRVDGWSR